MRNKKSGSDDRVGSSMAHQQGSLHKVYPACQRRPGTHTHTHSTQAHTTHRAAVGDTGVQKFPGTGGRKYSAHDTSSAYHGADHAGVSKSLDRLSRRLAAPSGNGNTPEIPIAKGCAVCAELAQGLGGGGVGLPSVHCIVMSAAMLPVLDVDEPVEAPGGEAGFHLAPSTAALCGLAG